MKISRERKAFSISNYIILTMFSLLIVLPLLHIVSVSVSSKEAIIGMKVGIFPKGLNFGAYKEILSDKVFFKSLFNTIFITVITVLIGLGVDVMAAYCFTREFFGKKILTYVFIVTMYFSGGLIPLYIVVTRYLHLFNTYYALILPGLVSVWYIIIIRTQIEAIPTSLTEAAKIDGAKEYQVLFKIIFPLIGPTLVAIGMFIALGTWNMWFYVMIFTDNNSLWTLQYYLRSVVFDKDMQQVGQAARATVNVVGIQTLTAENFKMASIVLVALPIVAIYPFVQKYFINGILVGSVKE